MSRLKLKRRSPKRAVHVRKHAQRRALERYGLELTPDDFDRLHAMIRRGEALEHWRETNTRTLFVLEYQGVVLPCIYDKTVNHISTVLPAKNAGEVSM